MLIKLNNLNRGSYTNSRSLSTDINKLVQNETNMALDITQCFNTGCNKKLIKPVYYTAKLKLSTIYCDIITFCGALIFVAFKVQLIHKCRCRQNKNSKRTCTYKLEIHKFKSPQKQKIMKFHAHENNNFTEPTLTFIKT